MLDQIIKNHGTTIIQWTSLAATFWKSSSCPHPWFFLLACAFRCLFVAVTSAFGVATPGSGLLLAYPFLIARGGTRSILEEGLHRAFLIARGWTASILEEGLQENKYMWHFLVCSLYRNLVVGSLPIPGVLQYKSRGSVFHFFTKNMIFFQGGWIEQNYVLGGVQKSCFVSGARRQISRPLSLFKNCFCLATNRFFSIIIKRKSFGAKLIKCFDKMRLSDQTSGL